MRLAEGVWRRRRAKGQAQQRAQEGTSMIRDACAIFFVWTSVPPENVWLISARGLFDEKAAAEAEAAKAEQAGDAPS